ncbi:bacitracin resistance protein BacA [Thermincola ferriacetica]|uniref:Undecaprenyl-diphosphatase n=1 Tax=Thermincola ferriacetica TaxID=281456 RepID=A0A0L6W1C4_9FIRM|nr:undecaprenyl-diphosphate phosphatase [Thermincola ferriacetica]KNZ69335.1 bacitracin resistance protein BacA [Thermincola ferriacetica]
MTVLQAAILGLIQGLTEFLPISSSGHLVLFQRFFGLSKGVLTFDVFVHLGTLVAVFAVFWQDILALLKKPWQRLTALIITGTIPTGIMGLGLKDFFEKIFASGSTLGVEFIATGVILWWAESIRQRNKGVDQITYADAAFVGFMQGVAILPAISRSGLTIAGALFRGIDRDTAARFSFLISIPAILGAALVDGKDVIQAGTVGVGTIPLIVGTVVSAVAGYFAIRIMLRILRQGTLKVFSYYVWALGILVIILQLTGIL